MKKFILYMVLLPVLLCSSITFVDMKVIKNRFEAGGCIVEMWPGWIDGNTIQVKAMGAGRHGLRNEYQSRGTAETAAILCAQQAVVALYKDTYRRLSESSKIQKTDPVSVGNFKCKLRLGLIIEENFDRNNNCEIIYRHPVKWIVMESGPDKKIRPAMENLTMETVYRLYDISSNPCKINYSMTSVIEEWIDDSTLRVRAYGVPRYGITNIISRRTTSKMAAMIMAQKRAVEILGAVRVQNSPSNSGSAISSEFGGVIMAGGPVAVSYDEQQNCEIIYEVSRKGLKAMREAPLE